MKAKIRKTGEIVNLASYATIALDQSDSWGNPIELKPEEVETSHKDNFDEFYDRSTLRPSKIRLYVDENNIPIYGMIIYVIDYKKEQMSRSACGGYYIFEFNNSTLMPHPYQESICW